MIWRGDFPRHPHGSATASLLFHQPYNTTEITYQCRFCKSTLVTIFGIYQYCISSSSRMRDWQVCCFNETASALFRHCTPTPVAVYSVRPGSQLRRGWFEGADRLVNIDFVNWVNLLCQLAGFLLTIVPTTSDLCPNIDRMETRRHCYSQPAIHSVEIMQCFLLYIGFFKYYILVNIVM